MKNDVNMTFLPSVSVIHGLTDTDVWTRTGVAYPMQVNGLVPLTDTGTRVHGHGQVQLGLQSVQKVRVNLLKKIIAVLSTAVALFCSANRYQYQQYSVSTVFSSTNCYQHLSLNNIQLSESVSIFIIEHSYEQHWLFRSQVTTEDQGI